jgi:AraC-like DNA-binding protein
MDAQAERLTMRQPSSAEHLEAKPLDLGCGFHVPVRWSRFCALYEYERNTRRPTYVGEKVFPLPVIVQTVVGSWEFRGKNGRATIVPMTVVVGSVGQVYGCKHYGCKRDTGSPDVAYVVRLRAGALDELDEPLFKTQVLHELSLPSLKRSVACETDDEFDSYVFQIFSYVSRASWGERRLNKSSRLRIQRIKRFIEVNASDKISLGDIAGCVDVTPFTCIRQFKNEMGITPHQYLDHVRLSQAKSLLRNRKVTIPEVAARVGIHDLFYFNRWFAKLAGAPPGKFRNLS